MSDNSFKEALKFWVKLGFINFGGPAGQIAIMHREIVDVRKWISESAFMSALNFYEAVVMIKAHPDKYAAEQCARARAATSAGRNGQRVIAAGRDALAQALFEIHPELGGSFQKLTKAIRAQCGENFNFEELNKTGARALGFDI